MGLVVGLGCDARGLDNHPGGLNTGPVTQGGVGTWVAFDSDDGAGNRDLYVIRADGTGRRRLTNAPSAETGPSFSADGTKLAFTSDSDGGVAQIYLMDLATGVLTRVTDRAEGAHDPAFAVDGTRLGYRSGALVFTAMLDGSDERQATDGQTCCMGGPFGPPVFLADGQTMVYDDYNAVYSVSGGAARRTIVMPTTGEQSHPTLSPDGGTLVLQATCPADNAARSLRMAAGTGTINYACDDTETVRISPVGSDATHASWGANDVIVWGSVAGGTNRSSPVPSALFTWKDGVLSTLTDGSTDDRNPSWSPVNTTIGTF